MSTHDPERHWKDQGLMTTPTLPSGLREAELVAQIQIVAARMQHDIAKYGELACDYDSYLKEINTELTAIRSLPAQPSGDGYIIKKLRETGKLPPIPAELLTAQPSVKQAHLITPECQPVFPCRLWSLVSKQWFIISNSYSYGLLNCERLCSHWSPGIDGPEPEPPTCHPTVQGDTAEGATETRELIDRLYNSKLNIAEILAKVEEHAEQLELQRNNSQRKLAAVTQERDAACDLNDAHKKLVDTCAREICVLRSDRDKLRDQLDAATRFQDLWKTRAVENENEAASLEGRIAVLQADNEKLRGEVRDHNRMMEDLHTQLDDIGTANSKSGAIQDRINVLVAQLTALQAWEKQARHTILALKTACTDVLLPTINEAIKQGYKMETWTPEQMQWAKAVEMTEALLSTPPASGGTGT